jgi:hypothetical protein
MNYQEKYQEYLAAAGDQPVLPFESWLENIGNELKSQLSELSNIKPMKFKHISLDIIAKCFDIQNEGKATVFFELSGHVQQLNIRIFAPVWKPDMQPSLTFNFYDSSFEENDKNLAIIMEKLNTLQ